MKKLLTLILLSSFAISLGSCTTTKSGGSSVNSSGRKFTLGGIEISEYLFGGIESWQCTDNEYTSKVLVELGYFKDPEYSDFGFILYDGTNSGDEAMYKRNGLDHRWDWGTTESNFSFVIKPDGTGLYYDFTDVPEGEKISAKDVYHCRKR